MEQVMARARRAGADAPARRARGDRERTPRTSRRFSSERMRQYGVSRKCRAPCVNHKSLLWFSGQVQVPSGASVKVSGAPPARLGQASARDRGSGAPPMRRGHVKWLKWCKRQQSQFIASHERPRRIRWCSAPPLSWTISSFALARRCVSPPPLPQLPPPPPSLSRGSIFEPRCRLVRVFSHFFWCGFHSQPLILAMSQR